MSLRSSSSQKILVDDSPHAHKSTKHRSSSLPASGNDLTKDSVVISIKELAKIRDATGQDSKGQTNSNENRIKEEMANKAKTRKEKILKMEQERQKQNASHDPDRENKNILVQHANRAHAEEKDDVKNMNQMMLYAKCVTIRDAQILEKKAIQEHLENEEKRLDSQMEIDRLRAIKTMEEIERKRAQEQKEGASVIITQMKQREEDRLRAQEIREAEGKAMLQRIKELESKEEEERRNKVVAGRKLLEQVMHANNAQARAKLRKKQEEIDEDMRIAEYIKQKEVREAEAEAELQRVKAEKEKEIARLRAMQERAQDRQSQIDEMRAKRYQEEKDRSLREQELSAARKKEESKKDIARAREQQRLEKEKRMAEQALKEREEFYIVLEAQKQQADEEKRKEDELQGARLKHKQELVNQIVTHEKQRVENRKKYLEEGSGFHRELELEKEKLDQVKQEKLKILEKAGVPEKYRAELARKKVMVSTIH